VPRILRQYRLADSLFQLPHSTPVTDRMALATFQQIIDQLRQSPDFMGKDTLLFQSWLKKGILLDASADYSGARTAYCQALGSHALSDSLAFVAQVYVGACYYNLNNFDSANYFLQRAESQAHRFKDQEDEVRLYNSLGVLYYDNGNYRQGKNYFDRALQIVQSRKPFDTVSAINLQTNIATSFYHLGLYQESLSMYNKILAYHIDRDRIYMNMGMAYVSLERYPEAMSSFRKVNAARMPGVLNEMGYAQLKLNHPDSSAWYLDRWPTGGRQRNDLDQETNDFYRADLLADRQQYADAIRHLQQAIILCSGHFSNKDIFSNPSNFTGTFASYRLFDALLKKAVLFERLFRLQLKEEYLSASYEAYKAALSILRYIEKNYDTDDAKIFLKQRNSEAYQGALSVCLELARMHSGPASRDRAGDHAGDLYLEQAFAISEKNKASIITANLEEKVFNKQAAGGGLLQKERNIKYNIARLNVKSETTTDSKETETIAREKAGYEIELSQVQNELEHDDNYYKLKYDDSSPGIKELQRHLEAKQALISFYETAGALHTFILTRSALSYRRIDSLPAMQRDVQDWLKLLKTTDEGKRFRGQAIGSRLYQRLIKPLQEVLTQQDEWIIIPDGFLFFLPFESLPAGNGSASLLETTTISYQFSSRLLTAPATSRQNEVRILAFAPFADKGTGLSAMAGALNLSPLPGSREEIAGLPGDKFFDSGATKERFLKELNRYPIVHLATHAVSSTDSTSASFIAFYPGKGSPIENRLFLDELYGLEMNATRLVVISACETGQGELVSKEGVISLARAFAYAGCESTISSLWKADDRSTSIILRQFYVYLEKGYTKSKALRQAKLDYLESDAINKSPAFWSHLILMGNTEPVYSTWKIWKWHVVVAGAVIILLGILFWVKIAGRKKRKKKKSTLFKDGGF
jgi:CHAT domain-containing protein